jgi:hypothetical protein
MLLLVVLAAGVATVPLAGGRLGLLFEVRFRHRWAIVGALAVQILILSILPKGQVTLHHLVHFGSYTMAAWFLFANRRVAFLWLVAAGGAANLLAISANDGVMPARRGALSAAGLQPHPHQFANSSALAHPRLLFLGDMFAVPRPFPLANVFSVGDIAIVIGTVLGIHVLCGSRLNRPEKGTDHIPGGPPGRRGSTLAACANTRPSPGPAATPTATTEEAGMRNAEPRRER